MFDGHRHHRDGHRILVQVQELAHACRGLQQVRRRGTGGIPQRAGGYYAKHSVRTKEIKLLKGNKKIIVR